MIQKIKNNQQDYEGFLFIITLGVALVAIFLLRHDAINEATEGR